MCVRMCPLTYEEACEALAERARSGRARVARDDGFDPFRDAYPGAEVPAYVLDGSGSLATVRLEWGFPLEGRKRAVYNTRIETALAQLRQGRRGIWSDAIANGRCLVPVRAFYEGSLRTPSDAARQAPARRQYRFRLPRAGAFLLAGVSKDGRLSIVTTAPNADVAAVHDRMPLVLGPGESSIWMGPDFARLADRSAIALTVEPE